MPTRTELIWDGKYDTSFRVLRNKGRACWLVLTP
jgi:hypothetical protein